MYQKENKSIETLTDVLLRGRIQCSDLLLPLCANRE
ncbi:MAG: hypothetical protein ACI8RD_010242 [Bacillariaceae sp.]|jgi:hypothetical protein